MMSLSIGWDRCLQRGRNLPNSISETTRGTNAHRIFGSTSFFIASCLTSIPPCLIPALVRVKSPIPINRQICGVRLSPRMEHFLFPDVSKAVTHDFHFNAFWAVRKPFRWSWWFSVSSLNIGSGNLVLVEISSKSCDQTSFVHYVSIPGLLNNGIFREF